MSKPRSRCLCLPFVVGLVAVGGFWKLKNHPHVARQAEVSGLLSLVGAASKAPSVSPKTKSNETVRIHEQRTPLFRYVALASAASLSAALPAPAREIHYVVIDRALVAGKQSPFWQKPGAGRLAISLPDGRSVSVAIESSEMLG